MSTKGRPLTTGRFDTRTHLIESAWFLYDTTSLSVARVAENLHVSESTAHNILKSRPAWVKEFR